MFHEGQQIGLYTLVRKIGRGGFGEVWLAERRSRFFARKVAVKLPLAEQVDFEAVRQEATLWAEASGHANVLPIIDADVYGDQVVIVSEYAEGGSLAEKLKSEGKFTPRQAVAIASGILHGLEYLHRRGIIHRDIKPQNILLQNNVPRLADFGISRAIRETGSLSSSTVIGTDSYMSPESFRGRRDFQTDLWSVGVVLYQLVVGRLPFPQEHPSEKMYAILHGDFAPLPPDVPAGLKKVIARALAKQRERRYRTAREMRDDLRRSQREDAFEAVDAIQPPLVEAETATLAPRPPRSEPMRAARANAPPAGAGRTFSVKPIGAVKEPEKIPAFIENLEAESAAAGRKSTTIRRALKIFGLAALLIGGALATLYSASETVGPETSAAAAGGGFNSDALAPAESTVKNKPPQFRAAPQKPKNQAAATPSTVAVVRDVSSEPTPIEKARAGAAAADRGKTAIKHLHSEMQQTAEQIARARYKSFKLENCFSPEPKIAATGGRLFDRAYKCRLHSGGAESRKFEVGVTVRGELIVDGGGSVFGRVVNSSISYDREL